MNTDGKVMGWIFDEYSKFAGFSPGRLSSLLSDSPEDTGGCKLSERLWWILISALGEWTYLVLFYHAYLT